MSESIYPIISRKEAKALGLNKYFTGKPCCKGHISQRELGSGSCLVCKTQWNIDNPEKIKNNYKQYYKNNKETVLSYHTQYRKDNAEKLSTQGKVYDKIHAVEISAKKRQYRMDNIGAAMLRESNYRKSNPEKVCTTRTLYRKKRRLIDPLYKMTEDVRNLIRSSMARGGFSKSGRTSQILGCSFEEFKVYIEDQFTEGMSWDNHGKWHYDHIYPVAKATDEAHLIEINHYTNFQPLWALDNILKSDNIPDGY
ncbi:hypothetical protein M0R04_07680 [Candidatus Dojkabacteria bacterium]|nr:hypothetical protein [Candidatus Dojkabacteria bacterium]